MAAGISVGILVATAVLVALSLRKDPPDAYEPTPTEPAEVGDSVVGPVQVTVDASNPDRWAYFDFSRGAVVDAPGPTDWDMAFRRFDIAVNGGAAFAGRGGALDLGTASLDSVRTVPDTGYAVTDAPRDSVNPTLDRWYDYGFTSHLLTPKPTVWAVRTADGRFALVQLLSYYCTGARPGCITMRYVYLGHGGRSR